MNIGKYFSIEITIHIILAYTLANADYDVWLMNVRGNVYSRNHISKNPNNSSSGFWEFTWYEIGIHDTSRVIDYVLEKTNNQKLYYIGFSQGTTTLMVLLSERPEYNDKILAASLLAPIGYIKIFRFLVRYLSFLLPVVQVMCIILLFYIKYEDNLLMWFHYI